MGERRQGPGEQQWERESGRRIGIGVVEFADLVLEAEQGAWIDLERQVQVDRPAARLFGMQIDFPQLAQRIGLDEVPLVVHVKPVIDRMALQIAHEAGYIDDRHVDGHYRLIVMNPDPLGLLNDVVNAVALAMRSVSDFGPSGGRDGQYALDIVADEAALSVLRSAGVGVLSEESGLEHADRRHTSGVVVIDPIDGSTNASRGIPWFATSLCLVDADGPAASLVVNQASGVRYWATRGGGAFCDGVRLRPSGCTDVTDSIVGLNGLPPAALGYRQSRVLGAVALDLCLVAAGALDGYVDCVEEAHGAWDYLGGVLICHEAGAVVTDLLGRDLCVLDHAARRTPIAAATHELHAALLAARADLG